MEVWLYRDSSFGSPMTCVNPHMSSPCNMYIPTLCVYEREVCVYACVCIWYVYVNRRQITYAFWRKDKINSSNTTSIISCYFKQYPIQISLVSSRVNEWCGFHGFLILILVWNVWFYTLNIRIANRQIHAHFPILIKQLKQSTKLHSAHDTTSRIIMQ